MVSLRFNLPLPLFLGIQLTGKRRWGKSVKEPMLEWHGSVSCPLVSALPFQFCNCGTWRVISRRKSLSNFTLYFSCIENSTMCLKDCSLYHSVYIFPWFSLSSRWVVPWGQECCQCYLMGMIEKVKRDIEHIDFMMSENKKKKTLILTVKNWVLRSV